MTGRGGNNNISDSAVGNEVVGRVCNVHLNVQGDGGRVSKCLGSLGSGEIGEHDGNVGSCRCGKDSILLRISDAVDSHLDVYKRLLLIADAVFEGILDERDKHQGWYCLVGCLAGQVDKNLYLVGIAQLHECHIMADEVKLTSQRNTALVTFIKDEAHHL